MEKFKKIENLEFFAKTRELYNLFSMSGYGKIYIDGKFVAKGKILEYWNKKLLN